MSQATPKNFFSRVVAIPAASATSLNTLLVAAGWVETDSRIGGQCMVKPITTTVYVGDDENVRDAAGLGVYQGFPLDVGDIANLAGYTGLLVDPNETWVYNAAGDSIGLMLELT